MLPEWNAIVYRLLDTSFRVTVFAGMVALILAAARVRSNNVRHAAWTTVLIAMLFMPVLPQRIPFIRISLPVPVADIQNQIGIPEAASLPATSNLHNVTQKPIQRIFDGPMSATSRGRRLALPLVVIVSYCTCVFILLSRALSGLTRMSRIMRESKPVVRETLNRPELRMVRVPLY